MVGEKQQRVRAHTLKKVLSVAAVLGWFWLIYDTAGGVYGVQIGNSSRACCPAGLALFICQGRLQQCICISRLKIWQKPSSSITGQYWELHCDLGGRGDFANITLSGVVQLN